MKTFFVGIKGVVVQDDKILLIKSNKDVEGRDHWEAPGGRIDDNETIEQALRRELSEECPNIQDVSIHEILYAHRVERDIVAGTSLVLIFYRVTAHFQGEVQLSEEHTDYQWLDKREALKVAHPIVAEAIKNINM